MRNGFDAGVTTGGIRNSYEVNILICYILKLRATQIKNINLKREDGYITHEELTNILLKDSIVNYFEFTNSLSELISLNQIEKLNINNKKAYFLTKKGESNLDVLELEIPKTIREKMSGKISVLEAQKKRLQKNKATIKKVDDGFILVLEILDIGSNLLTLEIFAPDEFSANLLKKKFLNNPKLLYQSIISTLTGDTDSLNELLKNKKEDIF